MIAVPDPPPTYYLALDPGLTTGVAWLSGDEFGFREVRGRFEMYRLLREWSSAGAMPEIVCEDWNVRKDTARKSSQPDPWRIIGYTEGLADQHGWPFTLQSPASAKSFATDSKLKALGWQATTPGGHARDAARHLLTYLVRRYPAGIGHQLLERIMETM